MEDSNWEKRFIVSFREIHDTIMRRQLKSGNLLARRGGAEPGDRRQLECDPCGGYGILAGGEAAAPGFVGGEA